MNNFLQPVICNTFYDVLISLSSGGPMFLCFLITWYLLIKMGHDTKDLRKDMEHGFNDLRTEVYTGFKELRGEISAVHAELKSEIKELS